MRRRAGPRPRAPDAPAADRGSTTLEYVVLFPAFLLIIGCCTQAALWYSARNAALAAAQEGVRAARVQRGTPAAGHASAAQFATQVAGGQLLSPSVQVSQAAGQTLIVRVSGQVPSFVPGLTIHVTQEARGAKERFVPARGPA